MRSLSSCIYLLVLLGSLSSETEFEDSLLRVEGGVRGRKLQMVNWKDWDEQVALSPSALHSYQGEDNVETVEISSTPQLLHMQPSSSYRLLSKKQNQGTDFLIFEAHARKQFLLLSSILRKEEGLVNSTSPALYIPYIDGIDDGGVLLSNPHPINISAIVFVRAYDSDSPVPGSCNTEPGVLVKPYLELSWKDQLIYLSFNQAGQHNMNCIGIQEFTYQVYQYFLPEDDCTQKYFEIGYNGFVDQDDIINNGNLVTTLTHHKDRISLVNYPRTGRIIAVIVNSKNGSSLYGLAHTYGIELEEDNEVYNGCSHGNFTFLWVSCALGVFVGTFLTAVGHRFFKCSQFLFGFYFGSLVGYILLSLYTEYDETITFLLTGSVGLVSAIVFLAIWWFLGIPVLSVVLPTLLVGFLLAGLLMYIPLCSYPTFLSDSTYWLTFTCMTLAPTVLFIAFTQKASIISCVVVGTFTLALAIDNYTGSNLKFIIGNVLHRATVPGFGQAYSCPPLQKIDLLLGTGILLCMSLGLVIQLIIERKKPPFPPAPFQQWRWIRTMDREDESTPLLDEESPESPEHLRRAPVVGFIHNQSSTGGNGRRIKGGDGAGTRPRDIFSPTTSPD